MDQNTLFFFNQKPEAIPLYEAFEKRLLAELEGEGRWLLTPFATDALVFVVNRDNPVDGLTADQVRRSEEHTSELQSQR